MRSNIVPEINRGITFHLVGIILANKAVTAYTMKAYEELEV